MTDEIIYIVDDDQSMRQSLEWLMGSVNLHSKSFSRARDFLHEFEQISPACLLLDMRMEGMSGLALQENLREYSEVLPIIILTGHADVPSAVQSFKKGAFDFIEKPFSNQMLLESVDAALQKSRKNITQNQIKQNFEKIFSILTPRERDVFNLLSKGEINKSIAHQLSIAEGTVESHRSRILEKLKCNSIANLIKFASHIT